LKRFHLRGRLGFRLSVGGCSRIAFLQKSRQHRLNLTRLRKSPEFMFGEDQLTVGFNVEGASERFLQFRGDSETSFDFGRQTGGAGQVVSNNTIADSDFHFFSSRSA